MIFASIRHKKNKCESQNATKNYENPFRLRSLYCRWVVVDHKILAYDKDKQIIMFIFISLVQAIQSLIFIRIIYKYYLLGLFLFIWYLIFKFSFLFQRNLFTILLFSWQMIDAKNIEKFIGRIFELNFINSLSNSHVFVVKLAVIRWMNTLEIMGLTIFSESFGWYRWELCQERIALSFLIISESDDLL